MADFSIRNYETVGKRAVARAASKSRDGGDKPCVYIVGLGERDLCKIGVTQRLRSRVSQMQSASPETLFIRAALYCATMDDARQVERELHARVRAHGLGVRGEWFDLPQTAVYQLAKSAKNELPEVIEFHAGKGTEASDSECAHEFQKATRSIRPYARGYKRRADG